MAKNSTYVQPSSQTAVKSAPGRQLCENSIHGNGICSDLVVEWADNMSQGGQVGGGGGMVITHVKLQ